MHTARVLVVDSDLSYIRIATTTLERIAAVRIVTHGSDVLHAVHQWLPDVVMLNMVLEDTDSFALLDHLLCQSLGHQPFVLCTVNRFSIDIRLSRTVGWPVGVISRSASPAQLRSTVLDALNLHQQPIAAFG